MAGIDGGDHRGRVPLCVGRGSTSAGTAEDVDHADENEEQDDNDFDPCFQSVRSGLVLVGTSWLVINKKERANPTR
jgi:hypothetical protein